MTALTKDRNTTRKEGGQAAYPVAAGAKIFAGGMVCLNAGGYAVPAANTAGLKFVGVSRQYVDNAGGADGAQTVLVWKNGVFDFEAAGMTAAAVGKPVFVSDDQTVALSGSNAVGCGIITEVEAATKVWVDIDEANRRTAQAQADSAAADVATLKTDFNALLAKLKAAGIMAS
ncbi:MAG: hypothetical protein RDV00_03845 [Clostridia bacterium]|nr:hypothetical protein [Clostridia bacterium]